MDSSVVFSWIPVGLWTLQVSTGFSAEDGSFEVPHFRQEFREAKFSSLHEALGQVQSPNLVGILKPDPLGFSLMFSEFFDFPHFLQESLDLKFVSPQEHFQSPGLNVALAFACPQERQA